MAHASTGDAETLRGRSGSVSVGSWVLVCTRFSLSPPNIFDGHGFDSKHDFSPPTILLGLPFTLGCGVSYFWWDPTFSCQMVVQQLVAGLEFSQEKICARPSTLPLVEGELILLICAVTVWAHMDPRSCFPAPLAS